MTWTCTCCIYMDMVMEPRCEHAAGTWRGARACASAFRRSSSFCASVAAWRASLSCACEG
eukprot:7299637-Prymnesium_polylepis.1